MKIKAIRPFLLLFLISINFTLLLNAQNNVKISCPEAAQYYAKDSINIVTFGASTVEGVNGFNFQDMLAANFKNCYPGKIIDITNEGIGGQNTAQGLLRIDRAIRNRTGFIIFNMGINDAVGITDGKLKIADTEANMRLLISTALAKKLVPILCTLQNVDDRTSKTNVNINANIKNINTIYRKLAKDYHIYLADINAIMRRDFSLYQDIFHPNARGYRLISNILFDTINKIIFDRYLQFTIPQNYPNPANEHTYLDIILPESDKLNVEVYDIMGRHLKTIVNEYLNTGKHTLEVNTSNLLPGVYIFKVSSDSGLYNKASKFIVAR
jgi:acyl-CoA thioesterase-1